MDVADLPDLTARLDVARALTSHDGHMTRPVMRHGSLELRILRPSQPDVQTPHDRDELYIVASGTAVLVRGTPRSPWAEPDLIDDAGERIHLVVGDAALVPAGSPHGFVDASDDFITWAVFWGPEGGEDS